MTPNDDPCYGCVLTIEDCKNCVHYEDREEPEDEQDTE